MELYQLRTFVTVAQQGHLTQAAELLHLSQPAVTAQIKALEEDMGMPLFDRSAGGVRLTRAGEELLPRAQSILTSSRDLLNHARGLRANWRDGPSSAPSPRRKCCISGRGLRRWWKNTRYWISRSVTT